MRAYAVARLQTHKDKIRQRPHGVDTLHGINRLDPEVAAVTGESDPKSELICCLDPIHLLLLSLFFLLKFQKFRVWSLWRFCCFGFWFPSFEELWFSRVLSDERMEPVTNEEAGITYMMNSPPFYPSTHGNVCRFVFCG